MLLERHEKSLSTTVDSLLSMVDMVDEATEKTLSKVSCLVNSKSPIGTSCCCRSEEEVADVRENREEVRLRRLFEAVQCALRSTFMVNLPFLRICTSSLPPSLSTLTSFMTLNSGVDGVR